LRVCSGSNKTHKALKPFSVVKVREPQVFQAVRKAKDVTIEDYMIGRLRGCGTFPCHSPSLQAIEAGVYQRRSMAAEGGL